MVTRKKLAIVSSYNESCGNASYTHVLKNGFSEHVDCDVISLDLFLTQKTHPTFVAAAEAHIADIAGKLRGYDYVNIQFEAGLFGATQSQILRRVKALLAACENVVVTMHRIDPPATTLKGMWQLFFRQLLNGRPINGFRDIINAVPRRRYELLYQDVVEACAARAKAANVWIAVHTRRERRLVEDIFGFKNVFDYPLTFLAESERRAVLSQTDEATFRARHGIADGVKVVGAFGFFGAYKGYETLIKALAVLPSQYHLYIFGGQHPATVAYNIPIDPYLNSLLGLISKGGVKGKESDRRAGGSAASERTTGSGANLQHRVHFVGELSDPDFIEALRASDAVVLPYLEIGQSMSGVIGLGVECGANLFCARNKSFGELNKYYGDVYTAFDIGNHLELAEKIQKPANRFEELRESAFRKYNLSGNIALHLGKLGFIKSA